MGRNVIVPHLPTKWDAATESRIPSVDLNPAAAFGKLVVLYDEAIYFKDMQKAVDSVMTAIDVLARKEDYILCVGDPVLSAAAMSYVSRRFELVRALRWDKSKGEYEVVEFQFEFQSDMVRL